MNDIGIFKNREEAGKALAEALLSKALPDPVVLALPRGGVPVAAEVARALKAPLDLVMVRKIGVPYQPELAAAAVIDGEDPQLVINEEVCALADVSRSEIDAMAKEELQEIDRRTKLYLKDRPRAPIAGRSAIVVDDGIATGTTIRAVIKALRLKGPKSIVLAVPVAPPTRLRTCARRLMTSSAWKRLSPFSRSVSTIGIFTRSRRGGDQAPSSRLARS